MSNFIVNKTGLDQVTLEMMTTGRSEASINLQESLLDETLNYQFCVDHLNVPLNAVPINDGLGKELFRIIRRNVGESLNRDDADTARSTLFAGEQYVYTIDQNYYDVPSFVRSLNNWCRGVASSITIRGHTDLRQYGGDSQAEDEDVDPPLRLLGARDGANPYEFIRFKIGVDGTLITVMTHDFTNNYILKFSRYGAEILGFGGLIETVRRQPITNNPAVPAIPLLLTGPAQDDFYLFVTTVGPGAVQDFFSFSQTDALVAGVGNPDQLLIIQAGENTREVTIYSEHSLYMCLDQRIKISMTSHLPMQNNMLVREGKQTVDRNIVEVYFDNKITTTLKYDEQGAFTEQTITNTLFAGQYPFVKKSDQTKQWHRLLTSYDLRFFRFHIYMTYRSYDSVKDEWVLKTDRLKIDDERYWEFSLRFISEV